MGSLNVGSRLDILCSYKRWFTCSFTRRRITRRDPRSPPCLGRVEVRRLVVRLGTLADWFGRLSHGEAATYGFLATAYQQGIHPMASELEGIKSCVHTRAFRVLIRLRHDRFE